MNLTTAKLELTMESLALPRELYWEGKMEPSSPSMATRELFALNDTTPNWLYDDNFVNELTIMSDESADFKQNMELINGEDFVIELMDLKEEYMLDGKYIDYSNTNCLDIVPPNPLTKVHAASNELLNYFGTNNLGFDTAILAQLTPPQSPPQNVAVAYQQTPQAQQQQQQQLLQPLSVAINETEKNYQQPLSSASSITTTTAASDIYNVIATPTVAAAPAFNFNWPSATNNNHATNVSNGVVGVGVGVNENNDIARDMQLVDEILNIRAQELHDWHGDDDCASQTSSNCSQMSGNDDDWLPTSSVYCSSNGSSPIHQTELANNNNNNIDNNNNTGNNSFNTTYASSTCSTSSSSSSSSSSTSSLYSTSAAALKKRTRTYGRGIEDRKIRKKEQNKKAATRYRQKKKLEIEEVLSEEQQLVQRNEELKRMLAEREHEAKYLRKLIREFYRGRKI